MFQLKCSWIEARGSLATANHRFQEQFNKDAYCGKMMPELPQITWSDAQKRRKTKGQKMSYVSTIWFWLLFLGTLWISWLLSLLVLEQKTSTLSGFSASFKIIVQSFCNESLKDWVCGSAWSYCDHSATAAPPAGREGGMGTNQKHQLLWTRTAVLQLLLWLRDQDDED